jgi:hypothetical protein
LLDVQDVELVVATDRDLLGVLARICVDPAFALGAPYHAAQQDHHLLGCLVGELVASRRRLAP